VLILVAWAVSGCGDGSIAAAPAEKEPNNGFSEAQALTVDSGGQGTVSGTLVGSKDFDVFDLGQIQQGQMFSVFARLNGCPQDSKIVIGLFSDDEVARLSSELDCGSSEVEAFSYQAIKTGHYFLAIAFGEDGVSGSMAYRLRVSQDSRKPLVFPGHETVFLDFNGATRVWIGGEFWETLLPLSSTFGASRATLIAGSVLETVRQDYAGFDIDILSSYERAQPSAAHSVVYLAGNRGEFLGLADSVNWYNSDLADRAVIFGGNFDFAGWTTVQIAKSIGNVVSHELGHLVGLSHTDDDTELMDKATPDRLLRDDQDFHRAPLSEFPIGWQDPIELLDFILGLSN
jgi:hypothetical protein